MSSAQREGILKGFQYLLFFVSGLNTQQMMKWQNGTEIKPKCVYLIQDFTSMFSSFRY